MELPCYGSDYGAAVLCCYLMALLIRVYGDLVACCATAVKVCGGQAQQLECRTEGEKLAEEIREHCFLCRNTQSVKPLHQSDLCVWEVVRE